ncbi:MAG: flagellar basal body-associated FliL family protein [Verrucomicrobia bacterium]|nr:flagellar basal body-associated FliL family protein [Verrucomicrobiota bacterium]
MADETPESAAESEDAASATATSTGVAALLNNKYLPLIVAVVVMPIMAWGVIKFRSSGSKAKPEAAAESHAAEAESSHGAAPSGGGHGGGGHGGAAAEESSHEVDTSGDTRLTVPVPITRDPVAFQRKARKPADGIVDYDKIVVLDYKGEARDLAQADKIVVNISGTEGQRYAVARVLVTGRSTELIDAVNTYREALLDKATGALSSKTLDDINKPGFRNFLRAELLTLFNEVIRSRGNLIEDVIITEFVIQ